MLRLVVLVCAAQAAFAGLASHVSPASVTYLSGPAPIGLRAGPATYTYSPSAYAAPAAYAAHATFAAPATYAAPVAQYTPSYVKAVQHVHHVPAVTNVPIKTYHHTPALIQKTVDVARPAVQTRKFELRRPAIQKQFYDIEERVIVRPAGSALVELDEPISKTQKGSAVISPLATVPVHTVPAYAHYPVAGYPTYTPVASPAYPAYPSAEQQQPTYPSAEQQQPAYPSAEQQQPAYPSAEQQQPSYPSAEQQQPSAPETEAPVEDGSNSFSQQQQGISSFAPQQDLESVSIDNPEFGARSAAIPESANPESTPVTSTTAAPAPAESDDTRNQYEAQIRSMFEARRAQFEAEQRAEAMQRAFLEQQQNNLQRQQYEQAQLQARSQLITDAPVSSTTEAAAPAATEPAPAATDAPVTTEAATEAAPASTEAAPSNEELAVQSRSNFPVEARNNFLGTQEAQIQQTESLLREQVQPDARSVVPSVRLNPEINQANQQRLIELLTARNGVAEVHGYGEAFGRTNGAVGDAGSVRARVLSVTPAPENARSAGERTNTRRIVVSRPIETVQEIEVVEPATKIHRVTYQQPTYIKTARLGVARVATSVPVYTKSLQAHPIAYY